MASGVFIHSKKRMAKTISRYITYQDGNKITTDPFEMELGTKLESTFQKVCQQYNMEINGVRFFHLDGTMEIYPHDLVDVLAFEEQDEVTIKYDKHAWEMDTIKSEHAMDYELVFLHGGFSHNVAKICLPRDESLVYSRISYDIPADKIVATAGKSKDAESEMNDNHIEIPSS